MIRGNKVFRDSQREAEKENRRRCAEIMRRSPVAKSYYEAVKSSCQSDLPPPPKDEG